MAKAWGKFILWSIIGWIIITLRYNSGMFINPFHYADPIEAMFFLIGQCVGILLSGAIIGSIIFGIWYALAGRKQKQKETVMKKPEIRA